MKNWQKLTESPVMVGIRKMVLKTYRLPSGATGEFTTYNTTDSAFVAVIALTKDHRVVIARQFRPGPEQILDELPGGGVEPGEQPIDAARRELMEETGYAGNMQPLGPSVEAYKNSKQFYFLATDCEKVGEQHLDKTEDIEVALISIDQLIDNAKSARMGDPAAVLQAMDILTESKAKEAVLI